MNAPSSQRRLIYIVAAKQDAEWREPIHAELEALAGSDFGVWSRRLSLAPGSEWEKEMWKAREQAAAAVVVLSTHSVSSEYVRKEIEHLQELSVLLFPILAEACKWTDVPGMTSITIFDEARPLNTHPVETQREKIAEFARAVLARLRDWEGTPPLETQSSGRDFTSEERQGALTRGEMSSEQREQEDEARLRNWSAKLSSTHGVAEALRRQEGGVGREDAVKMIEALADDQREIRDWFETEANLPEEALRMIAHLGEYEAEFREKLDTMSMEPAVATESTERRGDEAPRQKTPTDKNLEIPAVTIKFSSGSRRALRWADAFRARLEQRHVHTEHLIAGLYQSKDERVLDAFNKAGIDWPKLLSVLHQSEAKIPITPEIRVKSGNATALPVLSGGAKASLGHGVDLARSEKSAVLPRHLLFGVLSVDAAAAHTLRKRGLRREWLIDKIVRPAPSYVSPRTFALFQSDVPPPEIAGKEAAVPDALKLGDYARHLAEMMGAKETPLPLSLGLFGDWGTGKTHFMRLLREKMRAQQNRSGSPWCQHVVTVQFNAWHYLDANLWASLVTEIFERLFKNIDRDQKTPKEKKDELLKKLEAENGAAAKAKDEVRRAKVAERLARWKLWKTQKARDEKARTLAGKLDDARALIEIVGETPEGKELMRSWEEICRRLGWGKLETSAKGLRAQIAQTRSLGVRAQMLWETAFSPERRTRTLLLLVATLVIVPMLGSAAGHALGGYWDGGLEKVGRMAGAVSGWLTTVGAWLAFWTQGAQKYLGKAEQLDRRLSAAIKQRAETPEMVKMRDAVKTAEMVTNAAEKGLADAQARVRALQEELREQEPERRLLRFIGDRAKADDYRKHLGLVSLVRRDFETLSNLFAEVQAEGRVKPKVEGTLEAAVDRIILYVDDLDRCPAKRVVEVLEAVHLLLAFPLFVVVVAVDPRWLQRSLRQHYPELLDERPDKRQLVAKGPRAGTSPGQRSATPMDYLEKIFHVPFHLPRMEETGYRDLVGELTQIKSTAEKATEVATDDGPPKPTPFAAGVSTPGTGLPLGDQKRQAKPTKAKDPDTDRVPSEPEPRSVQLYPEEIAALQEYAAFIRTPRAVKRLLNTYRLVRAGLDEMPSEKAPSGADMAKRCAPAMLLLAVAAGFPWLARDWFAAVLMGTWTEGKGPAELQGVPEFAELNNAVHACKAARFASMQIEDWKWWIERVGRFTF